jgi:FkbM family methyltransferase
MGYRDAVRALGDLVAGRPSVRFVHGGQMLQIARDSSAAGTVNHLIQIDRLDALASHVDAGDTVIVDAGAHSGLFSALAARRAPGARIVALEPNPALHPIIEANLDGIEHWSLVPKALTDVVGPVEFLCHERATQASALAQGAAEGWAAGGSQSISVSATTLDSLVEEFGLDHIDVVKLDIQGAEGAAIAGAEKALPSIRKILIEVTFLEPKPERLLGRLAEEFGDPQVIGPVRGGADLLYSR